VEANPRRSAEVTDFFIDTAAESISRRIDVRSRDAPREPIVRTRFSLNFPAAASFAVFEASGASLPWKRDERMKRSAARFLERRTDTTPLNGGLPDHDKTSQPSQARRRRTLRLRRTDACVAAIPPAV